MLPFDSSRLSWLVLYTHSVSHAQSLWLHYTHWLRTVYGTLPDVVTPHVAQGYDENGVCLFCPCHQSPHLAFLSDVSPVIVCSVSTLSSWSTWLVCSSWILIGCFPPHNRVASALRHRWRGVWLPGHILPPHRFVRVCGRATHSLPGVPRTGVPGPTRVTHHLGWWCARAPTLCASRFAWSEWCRGGAVWWRSCVDKCCLSRIFSYLSFFACATRPWCPSVWRVLELQNKDLWIRILALSYSCDSSSVALEKIIVEGHLRNWKPRTKPSRRLRKKSDQTHMDTTWQSQSYRQWNPLHRLSRQDHSWRRK